MIPQSPEYSSKILLFGEYTLLKGSKALAIPFKEFSGRLEFPQSDSLAHKESNKNLKLFFKYLNQHKSGFPTGLNFDFDRFQSDLENGLILNSDIPQGYGVGSSGVVVASVYARYAINPVISDPGSDTGILKSYFSFMESFFHGKSSGLDPLSCFTGRPLLVLSPEKTEFVDFPSKNNDSLLNIFLLDTCLISKTDGLVKLFLEKCIETKFNEVLKNEIIPINNSCIDLILRGKIKEFYSDVRTLSALQLTNFAGMIPEKFSIAWENGINTGDYFLKLCGSGGGGFILGFTDDFRKLEGFFKVPVLKVSGIRKES